MELRNDVVTDLRKDGETEGDTGLRLRVNENDIQKSQNNEEIHFEIYTFDNNGLSDEKIAEVKHITFAPIILRSL